MIELRLNFSAEVWKRNVYEFNVVSLCEKNKLH